MNPKTRKLPSNIHKIINDISKNRKVLAVYLFGSMATGKVTPLSDTDICVIAFNLNEKEKTEILGNSSDKVDLVLFENLPFNLRWKILNKGKELYLKDKDLVETIKWRAFKDYQDFKPIIRRQMMEYLPGVAYV